MTPGYSAADQETVYGLLDSVLEAGIAENHSGLSRSKAALSGDLATHSHTPRGRPLTNLPVERTAHSRFNTFDRGLLLHVKLHDGHQKSRITRMHRATTAGILCCTAEEVETVSSLDLCRDEHSHHFYLLLQASTLAGRRAHGIICGNGYSTYSFSRTNILGNLCGYHLRLGD
nr:hypothetical protein CFP56_57668 [Quercus suber]